MDNNEKIYDLLEMVYIELQGVKGEVKGLKTEVKEVKDEVKGVKGEVKEVKSRVTIIEQDHGKKLDALFDGYRQNSEKLDRIEKELARHDEIILRRIK